MQDLDFEISFYENLLKENPDFTDALIALGDAYTKRGDYQKGLTIDLRLAKLKPRDPLIHYNLACSYSLLEKSGLSFRALEKAIRLGYREFNFMKQDPDLKFIRKDPRYQELLSKYMKKTLDKSAGF